MEVSFSQLVELLVFLGAILGVYVRVETKIKELDIRLRNLEKNEDRVLKMLNDIFDAINELRIELNNKQNRE